MVTCPLCNQPAQKAPALQDGMQLYRCIPCRRITLEGSSQWLIPGDGVMEQLRVLKRQMDDDAARFQLMMESPIDHPMWTDISP